ncbi:MAG: dihydroxyacetone kinase subunit DhaL [Candidatus Humimicrobiaceae bacterium]
MNKLSSTNIKEIFTKIKDIMNENEDFLFKLDSEMGDGDLGLTMSKGFSKVDEVVSGLNEESIGKIFMKAGMTLASAVPSTMGTLMATSLMKAGKAVINKTEVDLSDFAVMMEDFVNGIMERGRAKPGEKTIIDSLYPASKALKSAFESKKSLKEGFKKAYESSKEGVEATRKMTSKHGKAVYHIERSSGREDPGAVAGMLFIKAFYDYLGEL